MRNFILLLLLCSGMAAHAASVSTQISPTESQSLRFWTSTWIYQQNESEEYIYQNPSSSFQRAYLIYAPAGEIIGNTLRLSFHYALRQRDFSYRSGARYFQPMNPANASDRMLIFFPGKKGLAAPLWTQSDRGKIQLTLDLEKTLAPQAFTNWKNGETASFYFDLKYGTFQGFVNSDFNLSDNFSSSEGKFIVEVWVKK